MIGLLLTFHLIGLVGYGLLLRRQAANNTLHPWVLAAVLQAATLVVPLIMALIVRPDLSRFTPLSVVVAFVTAGLSILLYYAGVRALRYLEASTYAVVYGTRIIFATLLTLVILGEAPTAWELLGGLLILAAIVVLRQKGKKSVMKQGIVWATGAALAASALALCEKWLIHEVGLFNGALPIAAIGAVVMWLVVWIRKLPVPTKAMFTRQMVGLLVFRTTASWAWIFALAAGALVSTATYVSNLNVIIVAFLGVLLLGERDFLQRKIMAVALAAIGLSLLILL